MIISTVTVQDLDVQGIMLKKMGKAITFLAASLLTINPGQRIPTFNQLIESSNFSRGTLQNAMQRLEDIQAITLAKKGHLGTYLVDKNLDSLLRFLGISYVGGIMPIPYTKKYEGLATGLLNTFSRPGHSLSADIVYMRGSAKRIASVESGRYDFGITSKLSALTAINKGAAIEILNDFGAGSWLTSHALFFRDPKTKEVQNGMRLGIDRSSLDHVELTKKAASGHDVQFIDLNYNQIMKMISEDQIDAAVWNVDNLMEHHSNANYKHFHYSDTSDDSSAVMVISQANTIVKSILNEFVDVNFVRAQQQEVIDGIRYPNF
jgi:hypothetical protein